MTPRNDNNFLIEVPPEVYDEMKKYLSEEEKNEIELHYSPYWKRLAGTPPLSEKKSDE